MQRPFRRFRIASGEVTHKLTKCARGAALVSAFPDEQGNSAKRHCWGELKACQFRCWALTALGAMIGTPESLTISTAALMELRLGRRGRYQMSRKVVINQIVWRTREKELRVEFG